MIDGEGCIRVAPNGGYFTSTLTMAQTSRDVLDWLCQHLGGRVQGGFAARNARCKPAFHWVVASRQLRRILPALLPYLIVKKRHAEIVLAWYLALPSYREAKSEAIRLPLREPLASLFADITALNRRGPSPDLPPSP